MYSLGCVYYFTLTQGLIWKENSSALNLKQDHNVILANALITEMTNNDPNRRLTAQNVTIYPLFWESEKLLNFIVDISNRLEKQDSLSEEIKREMNAVQTDVIRGDWLQQLDHIISQNLQQRRGYKGNSVEDLVRAIRNKRAHYEETSVEIKAIFGELPNRFLNYWISRFPKLVYSLYSIANKHLLNDPTFRNLYLRN